MPQVDPGSPSIVNVAAAAFAAVKNALSNPNTPSRPSERTSIMKISIGYGRYGSKMGMWTHKTGPFAFTHPRIGVHSFELYPSVASVKGSLSFAYANRPGRSASVVETLEEVRTRCDAVRLFLCYLTTKTHESDRVR